MKTKTRIKLIMAGVIFFLMAGNALSQETFRFGRFGDVTIYKTAPRPSQVVLFVSGDGGWNKGVVDIAKEIAGMNALVAGIDIRHYLRGISSSQENCSYPAADFEALSKYIQKKFNFPNYMQPLLLGYSSGATLVYAVLAQSPPNTFSAAVSMGFCPDLLLNKPLCRGYGLEWTRGAKGKGYIFLPAKNLTSPWIAFQGTIDQVCNAADVEKYVSQVANGELVLLPKVGHGFSVTRNWLPQLRKTILHIYDNPYTEQVPRNDNLQDLPLVEVKADHQEKDTFAIIISGDGGWAGVDREVARVLAEKNIPVVGLDALRYFWKPRTPEGATRDLERIIDHYSRAWNMKKVILIGYSMGADVMPFLAARIAHSLKEKIALIALIGPSHEAEFEFHFTEWIGGTGQGNTYPLLPEMKNLRGIKTLCLFGINEEDTLCRDTGLGNVKIIPLVDGHHFGGDYRRIAEIIIKEMP